MKKSSQRFAGLLCFSVFLFGCSQTQRCDTSPSTDLQSEPVPAKNHFDYQSQANWTFESGDSQSPINIDTSKTAVMRDSGNIEINYENSVIDEVDNGHSIQIDDEGTATINGRLFDLTQFHFHSPSEHSINGKHYPLEVHFVNQAQDGRLAVIGVMIKAGRFNPALETILNNIKPNDKNDAPDVIDIEKLLPHNKTYYHYLGSLTTPPLSENVEWYVMGTPIEVSEAQIKQFRRYYEGNNRKIQPLNQRIVLEHKE